MDSGKICQLRASISPSNATNKNILWKSSNSAVAKVDSNGKVTAKKGGTAIITAVSRDGSNKKATCEIKVKQLANSVKLNRSSAVVYTGRTEQLRAVVSPSNTYIKGVTWKSSNPSVAAVNSSGKITAKKAGTAIITATSRDGSNKTAKCKIVVRQSVNSLTLNKRSATMRVTQNLQLKATVSPNNAFNKNITWYSSNPYVAYVSSNGKVVARSNGTAIITAATRDGSSKRVTCKITVRR